jgi:UDP-glucose 4-epimerase
MRRIGSASTETLSEETVAADLATGEGLDRAVWGVEAVIHLAAAMSGSEEQQRQTTVEGTTRLLDAMGRNSVRRLVLASSFSVYDWSAARESLDESSPLESRPEERDAYTRCKLDQERLVRVRAEAEGFALTVIRPGFVIGPGRDGPVAAGQGAGPFFVVIGPSRRVPVIAVERCAEVFARAVSDERTVGQTINVLAPERTTAWDLAKRCGSSRRRMPVPVPYGLARSLIGVGNGVFRVISGPRRSLPGILGPRRFDARYKPLAFDTRRLDAWEAEWERDRKGMEVTESAEGGRG